MPWRCSVEQSISRFKEIFGYDPEGVYFSPGRVNLIGEHTDYNGGHVFPCALTIGTYGAVALRDDKTVRMYSENFPEAGIIEFQLKDIAFIESHGWANYPKGVIYAFNKSGIEITQGFDMFVRGDIPNGAGLSSSASIEVLTAVVLNDINKLEVPMIEMVKMSQKAENEFIGVNCGIMDQFAVGMGREGHAMLLDTETLEFSYERVDLKDSAIIIANTNKRRGLSDSKYNQRRSECEEALAHLQKKLTIGSLGELTGEELNKNIDLIPNGVLRRRARHAVLENERTVRAAAALERNDMEEFGKLMYESHASLRDDYEVTGFELDTLVELASKVTGVIGSRMTGAGFGGCTVSIVKNESIANFIDKVSKEYQEAVGYKADFYVVSIGEGARRLC
ncbi:MAG: galactokinase [Youngiibacter sp.]|nr:galactokinase [Youngiibacter sp.]